MSTAAKPVEDMRAQLIGTGILLIGGMLVGLAPIGLRYAVDMGLTSQTTAFWRFTLAVPILLFYYGVRQKKPAKPSLFALAAGAFFALDIGTWHLALTITSVANATFILNLGNVGVGFLAWIFLKDRPSLFWGVAVLLALAGAYFLSMGGAVSAGGGSVTGDALALLAALFVSFYMLFATLARRRGMPALDVLLWATIAESVVAGMMSVSFGDPLIPPSLESLTVPVLLAVFVQIAGQGCIIYGVGRAPASISGLMVLAQPVTAAIISWPLFGERLNAMQLFGAGLIVFGLAVSQVRLPKKKSKPIEAEAEESKKLS